MPGIDLKRLVKDMKRQDQIITPQYTNWLLTEGNAEFSEDIAKIIYELMIEKPRIRSGSFATSSAGECIRAQVFKYLGAPQGAIDPKLQNIFNDGKWRHMRWQACLLSAGILLRVEEIVEWKKKRSRGTMDGIGIVPDDHENEAWRGKMFGFELKGVSAFLYPKYVEEGPKESDHLQQVARYMIAEGLDLFSIVYEDKSRNDWHEWVVEADSEMMKPHIQQQKDELKWLNESADRKQLPVVLPECQKEQGKFKTCPFGGKGGICQVSVGWPKFDKG